LGRGGREIWGRQGGRDLGEGEGEGGGARTGFWICDLRVKKQKKKPLPGARSWGTRQRNLKKNKKNSLPGA